MMPNMMFGIGAYVVFWTMVGTLLCLLLIGACTWLVVNLLKKQRTPPMHYTPQPQDAYQDYQQGYQPQQQPPETYQEGGQHYPYPLPQYEQPQAQYPQMVSPEH